MVVDWIVRWRVNRKKHLEQIVATRQFRRLAHGHECRADPRIRRDGFAAAGAGVGVYATLHTEQLLDCPVVKHSITAWRRRLRKWATRKASCSTRPSWK